MKILLFFLASISVFCLSAQNVRTNSELLWEISSPKNTIKSYLFGTLHSNDKRVFYLSDSVYYALDQAQAVLLETNIFDYFEEIDPRDNDVVLLFDDLGKPYTSSNLASKTVYGDEKGMPQFLDAYFQQYALFMGKKIIPLETNEEQVNALIDLPISDENQWESLKKNRKSKALIDLYLDGNLSEIDKFMRLNLSQNPEVYESLIIKRNYKMLRVLDSCLNKNQALFTAVGAGHLYGAEGIIQLLRNKGFKVKQVSAIYTELPIKEKSSVRKINKGYDLFIKDKNVLIHFPGVPKVTYQDNTVKAIYREIGQGNTYQIEIIPFDTTLTFNTYADIYIASPENSTYTYQESLDGTLSYSGLSDVYPEGMHWVQLFTNGSSLLIAKTYGGNMFMNSNRPKQFFDKIIFE